MYNNSVKNVIWRDFVKEARLPGPGDGPGWSPFEGGFAWSTPSLRDQQAAVDRANEGMRLRRVEKELAEGYKDIPEYERVRSFYTDIAPVIRMRQLGIDKLPPNEAMAFEDILKVPVVMADRNEGRPEHSGWYRYRYPSGKESIHVRRENSNRAKTETYVHELEHALARRIKLFDKNKLDEVYGPIIEDKGEEAFTTNREHQFRIYTALYDRLGRRPTADEYIYAAGQPENIGLSFSSPANGYEQNANRYLFTGTPEGRKLKRELDRAQVPSYWIVKPGKPLPAWADMLKPENRPTKAGWIFPRHMIREQVFRSMELQKRIDAMRNVSKNVRTFFPNDRHFAPSVPRWRG